MIIKSLRMNNFRQFKGETNISFASDPEKNVTIILGNNTYGKTTLLQAFNWCLYGKAVFDQNSNFLLNYEKADLLRENERETVEVEITVISNEIEYLINRKQDYIRKNDEVRSLSIPKLTISYKQKDGQTKSIEEDKVNKIINNILPEGLSSYFFFDTERVSSISNRKDVNEAVNGLLGLTALKNAIRHLGDRPRKRSVIGQYYGSMDLNGDAKAQKALDRIHSAQEKRKEIKESLKECESQIEQYEARNEILSKKIQSNQETSKLQKEKENLEELIQTEQIRLESGRKRYVRDFSSGSISFFSQPLLKQANDLLTEAKVDDKGIKDLTSTTIYELLERGRCICGQEICEGNEAYKHLIEELKYVPPQSIGISIRNYKEKLDKYTQLAQESFEVIKEDYEDITISKNTISDYQIDIDKKSKKIQGVEDIRKEEEELRRNKSRLKELENKRNNLKFNDGRESKEIESNQKIYDSLISISDKNRENKELLEYAEEIRDWLKKTYNEKDNQIRTDLQEEVNRIFSQMYHGKRHVIINEDYSVDLYSTGTEFERITGESEGTNRVKNFAFISGLVTLAKRKISADIENSENDFNLASEPYPLMMDAPFSNTDEVHIANISKILPDVAEQVIMFVMQKDWRYAEPVLIDRVGQSYNLNKISETNTQIS